MKKEQKNDLIADGYTRYTVREYKPGEDPQLDSAADRSGESFSVEGSARELAQGGSMLEGYVFLEEGYFVVYLPPEDPEWGSKSQRPTPGFTPSQEVAEIEFRRWLEGRS